MTQPKIKIVSCSCHCGGDQAYVIDDNGVEVMYGCICHNFPPLNPHLEAVRKRHDRLYYEFEMSFEDYYRRYEGEFVTSSQRLAVALVGENLVREMEKRAF